MEERMSIVVEVPSRDEPELDRRVEMVWSESREEQCKMAEMRGGERKESRDPWDSKLESAVLETQESSDRGLW